MSTNKRKPLVFPSIKVGTYAAPEPAPAPPREPEPRFTPLEDAIAAPAPMTEAPVSGALVTPEVPPESTALSSSPPEAAPAPFAGISTPLTRITPPKPVNTRWPYVLAFLASLLWAAGLGAFVLGNLAKVAPFQVDAFNAAVLGVLALAPLGFIWAAAYATAQAGALVAEARRAKQLTDQMLGPAALAAVETGTIVEAVRTQIISASEAAGLAREQLAVLREALAVETERLAEAAHTADRSARGLTESLLSERKELSTLAVTLDARAAAVTDAINRQAKMVAEASDLAEVQLREAEASLAARAADMAAAAGEATDASRTASEDLSRQIARLETAGLGVGDQMRSLEEGLTHQRASLVTVAHALRADQEDFAALAESRTAQLSGFLAGASKDVASLSEVTTLGAQSLSELIASAAEKFKDLAEAAKSERDLFGQSAMASLNALSEAGARERDALESQMRGTIEALSAAAAEAREAADKHAEAARTRVDQLNEAAFAAGQKADQVFEARLGEARGLIEQSAQMVEEAGAKTAARLDQGVTEARIALDKLQALVESVSARTASLPAESEAQAKEVTAAIARGMEELLSTARKASEETQAIDQAFQERVKRNYEMLSEAVQLMGVVAQGGQGASVLRRTPPASRLRAETPEPLSEPAPAAAPRAEARPEPRAAPPEPELQPEPPEPRFQPLPEAEAKAEFAAIPEPSPEPIATPAAEPRLVEPPLRPRLKLTPTASDAEFKAVFDAAGGPQPQAAAASPGAEPEAGWTWKELLTSIDGEAAGPDAKLGQALFDEIEDMGIDPGALLSRARIEEIAAAIQTRDAEGAREVVRTLAPAAIRRLSRRLIGDGEFRHRCESFVSRYASVIDEAAKRDKQGFQAGTLLNSNVGRAYLLLDAASGDAV